MESINNVLLRRQSQGSSTSSTDNTPSVSQLVATLIPVLIVAAIYISIFLIFRPRMKRNYAPRSYLGALRPQERSPDLPSGLFNWVGAFNKLPDTYVLTHHSLDGYLLLRYLKISVVITFVGCLITWPILFPVNATGGGGQSQLDILSFSNVKDKNRYYAHTFVAWVYFGFVFYMVMRESIYYINLRQAYLLSPLYAHRMSSRTVLLTSVPADYQNDAKLREMFGPAVKNLWVANDCKEIEGLVEERDKTALKLEAAETKLIKLANKNRLKATKKGGAAAAEHEEDTAASTSLDSESGSVAARWVPPKKRPSHRLPLAKLPIGKKVDTINWSRTELERLVPKIDALQTKMRAGEGTFICSAFVEFYTQNEAQAAFQSLAHHQPLRMAPRYIGVSPEEVIWKNLSINWASRVVRNIATNAFVATLIIFWAIPVAFVGTLSNIKALTTSQNGQPAKLPWLSFINNIPPVILGLVQGLLPSILLAVLMALLPIVLRLMAKLAGKPSLSSVELRVQNSYFLFQVIQVFLVTTASSSAAASGVQIAQNPSSALSILSTDLPKASNFYISYFILQGLGISAGAVLQLTGVILFRILGKILDGTPRKMYTRFISLSGLGWGTVFPVYTLLTVIALTYAVIAPLILGFATIGMYLIYLAYRYNMLFVFNANIDTKGLVYPRALQQTTTGVYLSIVCQIGLFAVSKAWGPLVLMVAFLIFIILFHISLNSAIDPLLMYLPKSLEVVEASLQQVEEGRNTNAVPGNGAAPSIKPVGADTTTTGNNMLDEKEGHPSTTTTTTTTNTTNVANGKHTPPATTATDGGKKPNMLAKFFAPHKHASYQTLRSLVPTEFASISYAPEVERAAYYHPAITSPTPVVWMPRDSMGISKQEIAHTSRIVPATDEGAYLNDKGAIVLDVAGGVVAGGTGKDVDDGDVAGKVPIHEEKVYY